MIAMWEGEIKKETTFHLITSVNMIKPGEKLTYYLNTEGGCCEDMEAILHILDENRELVKLVGVGKLYSAGFFIFFRAACEKELARGTIGMAHMIKVNMLVNEQRKPYDYEDVALREWVALQRKWSLKLYAELGMTSKEINMIMKEEKEVYFQEKRMREFLDKSNGN